MRQVREERKEIQSSKNNAMVLQFTIFCLLRTLDSTSSLIYIQDAWAHLQNWTRIEDCAAANTTHLPAAIRGDCDVAWSEGKADRLLLDYKIVLILTAFFNGVSILVFLVHLFCWVATLKKMLSADIAKHSETHLTRLTRSSMISLMSAAIRDIPISSLNSELLVLRSGREGLVCLRCLCTTSCPVDTTVYKSLESARDLLDFSYATILITSFWKGLIGLYRMTHTPEFNLHILRACAAFGFAFFYTATVFTPAMLLMLYRYFNIPGYNEPFLHDIFSRIVIVGITTWVLGGGALLCCPVLHFIRLR